MAKVSELEGVALDWAVATAAAFPVISVSGAWKNKHGAHGNTQVMVADSKSKRACHYDFRPQESWEQGGRIIEQQEIELHAHFGQWCGKHGAFAGVAPTPLVAAMRCFVASKLGEEVTLPEELSAPVRQL